jgi:hypothetical protein
MLPRKPMMSQRSQFEGEYSLPLQVVKASKEVFPLVYRGKDVCRPFPPIVNANGADADYARFT